MIKKIFYFFCILNFTLSSYATGILIPMDGEQTDHLRAYGVVYWALKHDVSGWWLLNYRGGSFLLPYAKEIESECLIRNVRYQTISSAQQELILHEISQPDVNQDAIQLDKAPRIAVYSPEEALPWDDAVTLVLTYAQVPYDVLYDTEIILGKLTDYDWLHLHHEDFTGQYGKFYGAYGHTAWYQNQVKNAEDNARALGFSKVSLLKLAVAKTIKEYVRNGGFLFAMCSGTDSFDIALAAEGIDICHDVFDGDPYDPDMNSKLDYSKCFAFTDFTLVLNPLEYEYSDIDVTQNRRVSESNDVFTLFEFSAKWDPVPTMLCQNHETVIKGFMGQTTAFDKRLIKPEVLIMGENKALDEARYIHGNFGNGTWTFYGGHDPEDYRHYVGDHHTLLELYPNSPGYRLILNNILFPAAKKKKLKT
ncbi:MAG TPA: asparagine synthetase B [Salinivirgaceae bacterium]|nr:asparagine synthetase B [Salinivirgaceae bacterium]